MATQQVVFAEAIAGLKRELKRKAYESDSDDQAHGSSNRGKKLLKRGRYVRQGQTCISSGPEVYKEVVEHAGYYRTIINRNPHPVDEYGYNLDSDDDDDHIERVKALVAGENPYSSIRLERILAPLTSASDLPSHPTMARPYTSQTLTELSLQARDVMHKENNSMWRVKNMLTQLCGDHSWAPTGIMEDGNDIELFTNRFSWPNAKTGTQGLASQQLTQPDGTNGNDDVTESSQLQDNESQLSRKLADMPGNDLNITASREVKDTDDVSATAAKLAPNADSEKDKVTSAFSESSSERIPTEKPGMKPGERGTKSEELAGSDAMDVDKCSETVTDGSEATANGPRPGKTSKALAKEDAGERPVHPFFLQPASSKPDRDFFLPQEEAAELRRLLQLYVQRQEEICRGSQRLYEGLLKADRLRKTVFFWSKAEAHCGESRDLSDGEDWYDMAEWGLEEPLKKGHDDEEEEAQQNQKKTRNRR